jgi:hypothetical protein
LQSSDSRARGCIIGHFHKAKTPWAPGLPIGHNSDGVYDAIPLKQLTNVWLSGGEFQIADKNIHGWFPLG